MIYRFTVRLKLNRDKDIIDWMLGLGEGERSCFIRDALRKAIFNMGVTDYPPRKKIPTVTPPDPVPSEISCTQDNSIETPASLENKLDKLMDAF